VTGSSVPFVIITLALVFYSIGVWSERFQGRLKTWHLIFFWLGLVCDTWGTGLMMEMAGGLTFDIHGVTGVIAILLMFIHAVWATIVLVRKTNGGSRTFTNSVWWYGASGSFHISVRCFCRLGQEGEGRQTSTAGFESDRCSFQRMVCMGE
jgi:uncharacterized repeat protein (TIGR03987 family)